MVGRKAKKAIVGRCHLCEQEKQLCQAHLLPRSLRKFISDDRADPYFYPVEAATGHGEKRYTLLFDPEILCQECDGSLGRYDKKLIDFVAKWLAHPGRQRPVFDNGERRRVTINVPALEIVRAFLVCLYRFAISERHPELVVAAPELSELKAMALDPAYVSAGVRVVIFGYYRHLMEGNGYTVDVTDIGRPFSVKTAPTVYMFEMFGLSIMIDLGRELKIADELCLGELGNSTVWIGPVQKSTPTFNHMYEMLSFNGAIHRL